ncbi:MAG: LamG domain-containing protein, partial [Planctomycetes bacterium]|nr:LamG domain-containing protein [Planctomycetota bacterium]
MSKSECSRRGAVSHSSFGDTLASLRIGALTPAMGLDMKRWVLTALCILGWCASISAQTPEAWPLVDGKFGTAWDARLGSLAAAARQEYVRPPLTVECWAKLDSKERYNILVANETKASATHWELFTTPRDGILHAFLPGRKPNHVHTKADIADGKWHCVAMIMEETRVRLYVDGQEKANEGVTATPAQGAPGPLATGALVEGNLVCDGAIDEVRLSKCVRQIGEPPSAEFVADEH